MIQGGEPSLPSATKCMLRPGRTDSDHRCLLPPHLGELLRYGVLLTRTDRLLDIYELYIPPQLFHTFHEDFLQEESIVAPRLLHAPTYLDQNIHLLAALLPPLPLRHRGRVHAWKFSSVEQRLDCQSLVDCFGIYIQAHYIFTHTQPVPRSSVSIISTVSSVLV